MRKEEEGRREEGGRSKEEGKEGREGREAVKEEEEGKGGRRQQREEEGKGGREAVEEGGEEWKGWREEVEPRGLRIPPDPPFPLPPGSWAASGSAVSSGTPFILDVAHHHLKTQESNAHGNQTEDLPSTGAPTSYATTLEVDEEEEGKGEGRRRPRLPLLFVPSSLSPNSASTILVAQLHLHRPRRPPPPPSTQLLPPTASPPLPLPPSLTRFPEPRSTVSTTVTGCWREAEEQGDPPFPFSSSSSPPNKVFFPENFFLHNKQKEVL